MREPFGLDSLTALTSPDVPVGIGLVTGDPREAETLARVSFCDLEVFREPPALLHALDSGDISAGVRGSLSASAFLGELRGKRAVDPIRRAALLVLADGRPLVVGPVGIDEGRTLDEMRALASDMKRFCGLLSLEPRVAVLSAGRPEDGKRGEEIASSIDRGEELAAVEGVRHFHIMIEDAVEWSNAVIAPDGVTGNLIYRTLAHLGGATSLGALYFPLELRLADTSRAGTVEEYVGAIALANIAARQI